MTDATTLNNQPARSGVVNAIVQSGEHRSDVAVVAVPHAGILDALQGTPEYIHRVLGGGQQLERGLALSRDHDSLLLRSGPDRRVQHFVVELCGRPVIARRGLKALRELLEAGVTQELRGRNGGLKRLA